MEFCFVDFAAQNLGVEFRAVRMKFGAAKFTYF